MEATSSTEAFAAAQRKPGIAAIVSAEHGTADNLLAEFARHLRRGGWRVRGVIQDHTPAENNAERQKILVDLDGDTRFVISQRLGQGSVACNLDPGGVAAASVVLRRCLTEGADLVIANRFGELEAGGGGFAAEMLALMAKEVPLLTVVADKYLDDWRRFTGGSAAELPARREALEIWFSSLFLAAQGAD